MNDGNAFHRWEADVERSIRRTARVRAFVVILFLLPFVPAILGGNWMTLFYLVAEIAIFIFAMRRMVWPRPASETIELPSSNPAFADLEASVREFARRLGLYAEDAPLRLDAADFGLSPNIGKFRTDGDSGARTYVHIPLGFLKFHSRHPDEARAILAHEIAHIRQGDWELWAELSSYLTMVKWLELPGALLIALVGLAGIADLLGGGVADPTLPAAGNLQIDRVWAARQAYAAAAALGSLILILLASRLGIAYLLARRRAASERLADRAAALLTSPAMVARAIQRVGPGRPWWAFLAAHPRNSSRLALLGESPDRIEPAVVAPKWRRLEAALSGNGLHRLFGLAGMRPEWRRLGAIAAMLVLTGIWSELIHKLMFEESATPYSDYIARHLVPGWWDWLADLRDWVVSAWTQIRSTFLPSLLWYGCLSTGLVAGLLAFRRDGAAMIAGLALACLLFPAVHALAYGLNRELAGWALRRFAFVMSTDLPFFLALGMGLTRRLSLAKSLALAVLASLFIGFAMEQIFPRSWLGAAGFVMATIYAISSTLALAAALLVGNLLAVFPRRK